MTGISEAIVFPPAGTGSYPARHDVRQAVFVRGGERIPVVVKRVRRDWRQPEGRTRAERSLRVARFLAERGVRTPEPLGIEVRDDESWFVAREVPDAAQVRAWFLNRDDPSRFPPPPLAIPFEEIVGAVGRLARRLHDSGVFFRDFTDGNILVSPGGPEGFELWLVDLDRARLGDGPIGWSRRLRDLSRLGIQRPEDRKLLLESYFRPSPSPLWALPVVGGLRRRIVFWDDLKRDLRPWKRERDYPPGAR